jgi:hypothetical protein
MPSALETSLTVVALCLAVVAAIISAPNHSVAIAKDLEWALMAGTAFEAAETAGAIGDDPAAFLGPVRRKTPTVMVTEK